ncbi:MAG: thioredoxin [Fulvimarina manganoxydans]|uniref:thioredoxin n=1 Tax=Fulvimarina manganoxydans TaxID=937218 RepID=UPI00235661FB|nr:thioredoxin [Fulvimarina manganoxydans]MCK5931091.1 thioredoxin [Fulvimarina manganoxydans]
MSNNPYANPLSAGYAEAEQTPAVPLEGFGQQSAAPVEGLIKDTTTAKFADDVIKESRNQPVLVDFWAPWCGPCKQLTPILEKVVKAARGKVKLVKMNIDEHPSIAGQLGVQSIPAVFAFVGGRPIDGFMGALPESELKGFIDRLIQQAGGGAGEEGDPIADALAQAAEMIAAGDASNAAQLYGAILQHEPGHAAATAGLAECYLQFGDSQRAEELLNSLPADKAADPAVTALRTKMKLAEEIAKLGDPTSLEQRLAANPDDHRARFDLALIAQAKGDRAGAAEHLLEIIRRDREFEDDGARRKLLEFFEVWGPTDPATKDARRKLSALLFR